MHMIYQTIWNFSNKVSRRKDSLIKKDLFLGMSIIFWSVVFAAVYMISILIPVISFEVGYLVSIMIYGGIGFGFFGGALYIYRNTTPKDL